jgi:transposase
MRKVREILRLHTAHHLTGRQIAHSLGLSHSTVMGVLHRAEALGLTWPLPEELDDATLEGRLYPPTPGRPRARPEPVWEEIHRELRRKGVTLRLLWQEYRHAYPDGYQYSRFCERYRRWERHLDVVLRQPYRAGEKLFVDWAGLTLSIVEPQTGQLHDVYIFVAALGMSNMTYLEGALAQDLPSWIGGHVRAFEYFGGAAAITVPDNTKTAVIRACRYEPELNRTYAEMAAHYGTVIIPPRPRKPRDRAKGESAVQVVERVVLAPLRGRTFFSLAEVNHELAVGRERLNDLPFQKLPGSRRTLFEALDRPALQPLPAERYELAQWRTVRVNIDYHCELLRNDYSVPYQRVHEAVEARLTTSTVELFYKGRRIASHVRLWGVVGQYSTDPQHRPVAHQKHLEWTPSRLIGWAKGSGPHTAALVSALLASKPHPEQGYRACLGVMRLGKRYSATRLDAACARALAAGAVSYRSVRSILETGLDQQPLAVQGAVLALDAHANVRGPAYYAVGVNVPHGRALEPVEANRPDGASDQASQMPQDRFARGGEGSGYPPAQPSLPGNASTAEGAAQVALISEEVTHADPTHA